MWGALLLALLIVPLGCGGGDSTNSSAESGKEQLYPWVKGPSREFIVPYGDNIVQTFGDEATPAERKQVSQIMHAWFRARAAKQWTKDCSYFSRRYAKELTLDANNVTNGRVKTCPQALSYFGYKASGDVKNVNLEGQIDSLRVSRNKGYAQYHGTDGKDWIIPVERENGEWKIGIAAPINRFR